MKLPIIIILCFFVSLCLLGVGFRLYQNWARKMVLATSQRIASLLSKNTQYQFDFNVESEYLRQEWLSSKQQFDRYNCMDIADHSITLDYDYFHNIAVKVQENARLYEAYAEEIVQLQTAITPKISAQLHIPYKHYVKIEQQLFEQYRLKPVTASYILCVATYTSPQGRNHYSKQSRFALTELEYRYKQLQEKDARRNSEESRRKRERAKMSNSLRYDVMHRDQFRCQLCGRSQHDGVKLHVDHIIPISKGGKTVKDNLRTLCDQCNLGKGSKLE